MVLQSLGEIKGREVSWTLTKKLDAFAGPGEIKSREVELGLRVGLLLLQLFPNGGAADIVFVTLFCIAVGTVTAWCCGRCAMPDGHCLNTLLFWRQSTAALIGLPGWHLFRGFTLLSPFSHSSPSVIGLLASVDVKQHNFTHSSSCPSSSSFRSLFT